MIVENNEIRGQLPLEFPIYVFVKQSTQYKLQKQYSKMVQIDCAADLSCPYQYTCDVATNACIHEPVFPIQGYPIAIYCLMPFAAALVNTTGNSFGEFKVVLLMIALNYTEGEATILCYPMVAGAALYNFILLMFRKHPTKNTTLVDYNIVLIIIPSVLYGSTIGTLLNDVLPPLVANILITILLAGFSIKFFMKFCDLMKQEEERKQKQKEKEKIKAGESLEELKPEEGQEYKIRINNDDIAEITLVTNKSHKVNRLNAEKITTEPIKSQQVKVAVESEMVTLPPPKNNIGENSNQLEVPDSSVPAPKQGQNGNSKDKKNDKTIVKTSSSETKKSNDQLNTAVVKVGENPYQAELDEQIKFEQGNHASQILAVVLMFIGFAVIVLLCQGKLVKFSRCSWKYGVGFVAITIMYVIIMAFIKKFMANKMERYQRIGYDYEYPLHTWRYFGIITLGALFGGFNAGLFSKGNSTTIIFTLIYLGIEPIVASAIVGFQVVFSAIISVTQAWSKGQLSLQDIGFFIGVTFIAGGILSHIVAVILRRMDKNKVNRVLVCIVGILTCSSAVAMLVSTGISFKMFGSPYMVSPGNFCK